MTQEERALARRLQPGPGDNEPNIRCDYVRISTDTIQPHAEAAFRCTACGWWTVKEFDPTDDLSITDTRADVCLDHP